MSKDLSRREFIKMGTGAALTAGIAPLVKQAIIQSSVNPPEDVLPGRPTWYASTCRQCSAGCGIIVSVMNGRAKKIEGNPLNPLNKGSLCARGQAGLQKLYNPDRLQNAVSQYGGRGSRNYKPLYWDEALEFLFETLNRVIPGRIAFLGGVMPDHLYFLVSRWLQALGAPPIVMYDLFSALEGRATAFQVSEDLFGVAHLPIFDIANADVVFSFGANFLETWQSPVAYGRSYGEFRQGQPGGRGYFVQFEPRLSATASVADEWVPLRPGTDGLVALALGRIILENNLGNVGVFSTDEASLYQDVDVAAIGELSEISIVKLEKYANIIASARNPVAIPGGYPAGHQNGFTAYKAIQSLNYILKRFGQPGGVYFSSDLPSTSLVKAPSPDSYNSIQSLIERISAGKIDILFIYGTNPIYEFPKSAAFSEAIKNVPYVVSFSPFIDETSVHADLILPDHIYLEAWGYQIPSPGTDRPMVNSQQPVVQPLYDTRSTADVILTLASMLGGEVSQALPWENEMLLLEDITGSLFGSSLSAYNTKTAGEFWASWRQYGGWWADRELKTEPEPIGFGKESLSAVLPIFAGEENLYPLYLYPYLSIGLSDGRGANLPWLQELPDPMTTACWQTWVELNPQTAFQLGVEDNDVVKIISPHGTIEAISVLYPGIRPDVIAIPIGQGHTEFGRYAKNRGSNPINLLAPIVDPDTGSLAWGATRVRIEPTGRNYFLARLESLDGEGRETIR